MQRLLHLSLKIPASEVGVMGQKVEQTGTGKIYGKRMLNGPPIWI